VKEWHPTKIVELSGVFLAKAHPSEAKGGVTGSKGFETTGWVFT
jgi:hypothetical protein